MIVNQTIFTAYAVYVYRKYGKMLSKRAKNLLLLIAAAYNYIAVLREILKIIFGDREVT